MAELSDGNRSATNEIISSEESTDNNNKKNLQPKRVLHFSDGVLEEYSEEEEEDRSPSENRHMVDPQSLTWISYLWYLALTAGTKTLAVCDYLGENLAYFFGITGPKYRYEIEEYGRMLQDEEEKSKQEDEEERAGWRTTNRENPLEAITADNLRWKRF